MAGDPRDMSALAFMTADELSAATGAEALHKLLDTLIGYQASHQDLVDRARAQGRAEAVIARETAHLQCLQFVSLILAVTLKAGGIDE